MNPWKLITLVLVLSVLGGLASWDHFHRRPDKEEAEKESAKLLGLGDSQISTIRLVDGGRAFTFECAEDDSRGLCKASDASQWTITEPVNLPGDKGKINAFLKELERLVATETLEPEEEDGSPEGDAFLKEFELDSVSRASDGFRRVEIQLKEGAKLSAFFGPEHPFGGKIYALATKNGKADDAVAVIQKSFAFNFDKDLDHWRDKQLIQVAAHDVRSLELKNDKGRIRARQENGKWLISSKKEKDLPGDGDAIDTLLTFVSNLKAKSFPSEKKTDNKAKSTLRGTRKRIELKLQFQKKESEEEVTLSFYIKEKKDKAKTKLIYVKATGRDPLFEVPSYSFNRFDKGFEDFRLSRLISSVLRFSAKKLEFTGEPIGTQPLVLEKVDAKWREAGGAEVDSDKVQKILDQLQGKRIKKYVRGKGVPKGEDKGLKVLVGEDPATQREFLFWKHGNDLYARDLKNPRSEALKLDKELKSSLPWKRDALKKK